VKWANPDQVLAATKDDSKIKTIPCYELLQNARKVEFKQAVSRKCCRRWWNCMALQTTWRLS